MIPKNPAPHLIRGGNRFSEKIMLNKQKRAAHTTRSIADARASILF